MIRLALIRHAPTPWNAAKRLQGRADIAIAEESRARLATLALPTDMLGRRALCSPLARCRQTASLLGLDPTLDHRLIEMDWGEWEGFTLAELHASHGVAMTANEAQGLDFRPPGGESPRDVQARVKPLLAEIARGARDHLAITHRGVIRAIHALATGWDMTGRAPDAMDLYALHEFTLDGEGRPSVARLNVALAAR